MTSATLEAWLGRIEQLHPRSIDLDLARVRRVYGALGLSSHKTPVVTVAGTNGKGSVVAWLESMLRAAGLRTGVYTSPHLQHYNERVRIDAQPVGDSEIVASFEKIESARADVPLTYFEYGTLAALALFRDATVDIRVLEVGLGGRLDAVNVIDADVAIVTSIGLDHCDWLGDDRDAIGREKAGIFRPNKPAVVGERDLPASVTAAAQQCNARLLRIGHEFDYECRTEQTWDWHGVSTVWRDLPRPGFGGTEQFSNASCALAAMEQLAVNLAFQREHLVTALTETRIPGRFQIVQRTATWILDVAHNGEAAQALADSLRRYSARGRTLIVAGLMADKPIEAFAAALDPVADEWWAVGAAAHDRAASAQDCAARLASSVTGPVHAAQSVEAGLSLAQTAAGPNDRIVVTGSFLTVAAALDYLSQH